MDILKTIKSYVVDENIIECQEGLDKFDFKEKETNVDDREMEYVRDVIRENICTQDICLPADESHTCIIGSDVLSDLEVIKCYNGNEYGSLLGGFSRWETDHEEIGGKIRNGIDGTSIGMSQLCGSQIFMKHLLSNPISDINKLHMRQITIKEMYSSLKENPSLHYSFEVLKKNERKMCWFYDAHKEMNDGLHDMVYLNFWLLDWLNRSDKLLTGYNIYRIIVSPMIGILTPILYIIIPYIILRSKCKLNIPFITYVKMNLSMFLTTSSILPNSLERFRKLSVALTIIFYFQSLFNNFELSKAIYRLTKILVTRMNGLINFVHHAQKIVELIGPSTKGSSSSSFSSSFSIDIQDKAHPPFFADFMDEETVGGIDGEDFTLISNFGKQLSQYKYLNLDIYKPIIQKVYLIDNILCIGRNTDKSEKGGHMSFVKYQVPIPQTTPIPPIPQTTSIPPIVPISHPVSLASPYLEIKGFYHPCMTNIPFDSIVKNDKYFGSDKEERNMILTGPNAGGKSTIIKSIMISILLAQTLGIANADSMRLTPFKFINTQINIPDSKGKQSLFEAEMYRSKTNFDILAGIKPHETAIIAMDEIFSSTNPVEGIAGAYAIAKRLGEMKNVINIISTHYIYLANLRKLDEDRSESDEKKKKNKIFGNYKMNVDIDANNNVVQYPYKLSKGISRQYVALELLKKSGFDKDIIDEAVSIKNDILK